MDLQVRGKVAFVTGASQGLGFATAHQLAMEGANLVILSRSEEKIEDAANRIKQSTGAKVLAIAADLTKPEQINDAFQKIYNHYGEVDILVANAGGPPMGQFVELNDDHFYNAFELNFMSTVRLIRGSIPSMKERGGGRIGIITSQSVKEPIDGLILSNSIRAGVTGLAKTLAKELAKDGILINCFAPGRMNTERVRDLDQTISQKTGKTVNEVQDSFTKSIPLNRYGEPEEFGRVAAFYLSFANTYVTGQTILIDGGKVGSLL